MKSTKSFFVVIGLLCATTVSAHFEDSPYAYCSGNPINAIDPDGCQVKIINGRSNSDNYMDLMNITENPSIVEISAPDNTKFSFEYKGAISKMHDCSNICDSLLSVYVEDKVQDLASKGYEGKFLIKAKLVIDKYGEVKKIAIFNKRKGMGTVYSEVSVALKKSNI